MLETIEHELFEWLTMFFCVIYFIFYLPIEPPHLTFMEAYWSQNFLNFYLCIAKNVTSYIACDLHPSYIVMPTLLLLYGLLIYNRFRNPPMQHTQQATFKPIFGCHYTVDCSFGLPATYMIFTCIMLLPNYIQLLKRRHRVYEMNLNLQEYSVLDVLRYAFFFGRVTLWWRPLRDPPRKFLSDGIVTYGVINSTRFGSLVRRALKLLLFLLVAYFVKLPFPEFRNPTNLNVRAALHQYRLYLEAWKQREAHERDTQQQYEVLMAQLERESFPRVVNFEADAFDMATDNCASRTCTPYFSDLYEVESVDNATLTGVGTGRVTHMGKARYVFLDGNGKEILIDDHKVIVCPNLPSRILSIPSWSLATT
jgi:hypothetical protein